MDMASEYTIYTTRCADGAVDRHPLGKKMGRTLSMDYESTMRNALIAYSRVPAKDLDRTEARMSASTGAVMWERMCLWMDGEPETLKWDASKLDDARLYGLRVRRDDSVPDGEVRFWTRR